MTLAKDHTIRVMRYWSKVLPSNNFFYNLIKQKKVDYFIEAFFTVEKQRIVLKE
jgi:hypothetical protein